LKTLQTKIAIEKCDQHYTGLLLCYLVYWMMNL